MRDEIIGYTTCNHCGKRFLSETYLMIRHMKREHPERWEQISRELEGEPEEK